MNKIDSTRIVFLELKVFWLLNGGLRRAAALQGLVAESAAAD